MFQDHIIFIEKKKFTVPSSSSSFNPIFFIRFMKLTKASIFPNTQEPYLRSHDGHVFFSICCCCCCYCWNGYMKDFLFYFLLLLLFLMLFHSIFRLVNLHYIYTYAYTVLRSFFFVQNLSISF